MVLLWLAYNGRAQKIITAPVSERGYQMNSANNLRGIQKSERFNSRKESNAMKALCFEAGPVLHITAEPTDPKEIHPLNFGCFGGCSSVEHVRMKHTYYAPEPIREWIWLVIFMSQHHEVSMGARVK